MATVLAIFCILAAAVLAALASGSVQAGKFQPGWCALCFLAVAWLILLTTTSGVIHG